MAASMNFFRRMQLAVVGSREVWFMLTHPCRMIAAVAASVVSAAFTMASHIGITSEYVRLSNGVKHPAVGLGTFLARGPEVFNAARWALQAGVRHIDTAAIYRVAPPAPHLLLQTCWDYAGTAEIVPQCRTKTS